MTEKKDKKDSIRKAMYYNEDAVVGDKSNEKFVRVNVRLSGEVAAYIEEEARRTGNTVSGICGLAITDWVDNRKITQGMKAITTPQQANYNINEQMHDPEFRKALIEALQNYK